MSQQKRKRIDFDDRLYQSQPVLHIQSYPTQHATDNDVIAEQCEKLSPVAGEREKSSLSSDTATTESNEQLRFLKIYSGHNSAPHRYPTTKLFAANFECILDVMKQLTGDSSRLYSTFPLTALKNQGICRWEDTELALDASWTWCRGTLHTALYIIKAHDVDPEMHFWAVVATMLLISLTAEEMGPILDWADQNAGRYRQVWLGSRHELPCLLYLLLWQPDNIQKAATDGARTELVRSIDEYLGRPRSHIREDSKMTVNEEQRAIIDVNLSNRSVVNVKAYAGTGKTTSAILQQTKMSRKCLMLSYNKSVQEDAMRRLEADGQNHVNARTMDSLIWWHTLQSTGRQKKSRFVSVNAELIKEVIPNLLPRAAAGVARMLKRFLFSDKYSLSDRSFNWFVTWLDEE
jgi:hypothetical protein